MNESTRIMEAYNSIDRKSQSTYGKRTKMLVGKYIIEQQDENGNMQLVTVNVPDEIL